MSRALNRLAASLCVLTACGQPGGGEADAGPPAREVTLETSVGAGGLSPEVSFAIPPRTRSVTVIIEGDTEALYALGALVLGDGSEQVQLAPGAPGPAMQAAYYDEEVGQMPGRLYQSIRLGTFTHVYPYRPDQEVVPGLGHLRVASDTAGPVRVTILMPEDDGAATLPLNLYVVSSTLPEPNDEAFTAELQRIFGQAGITVAVQGVERLTGTGLESITEFTEPQEAPASQAARLPAFAAERNHAGLDVFFVESLPFGVGGLSLGTPGPPVRGSYYFGVLIRGGLGSVEAARVTAHEVAHFLALQHVQNRGASGTLYPDPLDDTAPGADNLMESGTLLTPDQSFSLTRSGLLQP